MTKARGFNKTAITRCRTTAREDGAISLRRLVTPDNDFAAITAGNRICLDHCILTDIDLLGIHHRRILALVITTYQCGAATGLTTHINQGIAHQADFLTQYLDFATSACTSGRGRTTGFQ
ncbi:hypothetical protein D3C81_1618280 [compost metagenome]